MSRLKTRQLNKKLKNSYLKWIKKGIKNNSKNLYSVTLHLNPYNKFYIDPRLTRYDRYLNSQNNVNSFEQHQHSLWRVQNKDGSYIQWGGRYQYSKCLKYFINKLSDKIWGNNWNRRGQGFDFLVCFFEDGLNRQDERSVFNKSLKNPHYHIIIRKPDDISELKFRSYITNIWGFYKFKFNKKYKNRSGELFFDGENGEQRVKKIGGVFDHINIKRFYKLKWNEDRWDDDGNVYSIQRDYSFLDYGMKKFNEYDHKIDLRNFIMKGVNDEE